VGFILAERKKKPQSLCLVHFNAQKEKPGKQKGKKHKGKGRIEWGIRGRDLRTYKAQKPSDHHHPNLIPS
jgi:hypothetical protein